MKNDSLPKLQSLLESIKKIISIKIEIQKISQNTDESKNIND